MKVILFFLLLSNGYYVIAQSNVKRVVSLEYFQTQNNKYSVSHLTIRSTKGIYYSVKDNEETKNSYSQNNTETGIEYKVKLNTKDSLTNVVITNLVTRTMHSSSNIFSDGEYKKYVVKEPSDAINWQLSSETRSINNYACQKATAEYKGRQYEVWFTEELPFTIGPWKLHGLPGAVVYAVDIENFIEIELSKVNLNSSDKMIDYEFVKELKVIDCEENLLLKSKQGNEIANQIQTKLPRGAQFNITKISNSLLERKCN